MKKIFHEVTRLPEFQKDIRKLAKRFRTIEGDLKIFIEKQLQLYHKLRIDNKGIFQIPGLHITSPKIFKGKNSLAVPSKAKELSLV